MAEISLTQEEADALLAMEKHRVNDELHHFPRQSQKVKIRLRSFDEREDFWLDVNRASVDLRKVTYQNRAREVVKLTRLDLGGPPHANPDGEEISTPHLHVYRENHGDRWAMPVPEDQFADLDDIWTTLHDFMGFCHITEPPRFMKACLND